MKDGGCATRIYTGSDVAKTVRMTSIFQSMLNSGE